MTAPRAGVLGYVGRNFPGASIERLAGDASYRVFYRVALRGGRRVVLMDYGAPFEGETDDIKLGRIFRQAGLRVAEQLDASPEVGLLVLEDLGDRSLESAMHARGRTLPVAPPDELVRAVDLAARVAERGTPVLAASDRAAGPALDEARFRFEMDFYLEHFVGGLLGRGSATDELRNELHTLASRAAECPRPVLCHRDFHSRNLMIVAQDDLAMVDIQDARWGPDTYDLVSILRDAYVDIAEGWVDSLIDRYRMALAKAPDSGEFRRRFRRVAAQRMLKALGSFGWLTTVKRTDRYLDAIPRTLARIESLLSADDEHRRLRELLDGACLLRM